MAKDIFSRNLMFYGEAGFERLQQANVAIVGLGGVGSYAAEALVRAGIGNLRIIDCDSIKATDVNRQLFALSTNLETPKVEAGRTRLLAINPDLHLDARQEFFHFDTADALITQDLDFVVDAIDSLNPKAALIRHCTERNIRIISALGASSRKDPFAIRIATLSQTVHCPLARALRRHLRSKKVDRGSPGSLFTGTARDLPHGRGCPSTARVRRSLLPRTQTPGAAQHFNITGHCRSHGRQLRHLRAFEGLPVGTFLQLLGRLNIFNDTELGEKSQPVGYIPMFGYFAVLNPKYIHDIKVQFAAARGIIQPVAAVMSPAACAIRYDIVVFSHEALNLIFEVRHGDKGLFEESNETGLALFGNIVVLYIVIPHDFIQDAQIVIDKNSVDESFNDLFISFRQLQISPLIYVHPRPEAMTPQERSPSAGIKVPLKE